MGFAPREGRAEATTLWTKTTSNNSLSGWREIVALSNGTFAACSAIEENGDYQATIRCWDEDGTTLWTYQLPDPTGIYNDRLYRLRIAPDGSLLSVGASNRVQLSQSDLLFIRVDVQGNLIQTNCVATNGSGVNAVDDLDFDSLGNLLVSYSQTGLGQYDFSKFSPTFSLLWRVTTNQVLDVEVLDNGNIAVCGQVFPPTVALPFFAILAPNGTTIYQRVYAGETDQFAYGLATASDSRVYVARTTGPTDQIELYTGSGTPLGSISPDLVLYPGCQIAYHEATDSLFYGGAEYATNDLCLVRYNGIGQEQWRRRRGASIVGGDVVLDLDRFGNPVLAAPINPQGTNHNMGAWCYSVAGEQQWFNQLNGTDTTDDKPRDLAVDNQLRLIIAGNSNPAGNPNGLNQALLWRTSQFFNAKPSNMALRCGQVFAGSLDSLGQDDGEELAIRRFAIRSTEIDYIKAEFDTQFPISEVNPGTTDLRFVIRARSNTTGVHGTVQLWDYNAAAWTNTTPITLGQSESALEIPVTNMSRYIQNGSRRVKARLYVAPQGAATPRNLTVRIDQIAWRSDT